MILETSEVKFATARIATSGGLCRVGVPCFWLTHLVEALGGHELKV